MMESKQESLIMKREKKPKEQKTKLNKDGQT